MAEALNQCAEFDAVYSSQKVIHVNERGTEQSHFYRFADDVLDQAAFLVDHCSVMHRRSLLRRVKEKFGSFGTKMSCIGTMETLFLEQAQHIYIISADKRSVGYNL